MDQNRLKQKLTTGHATLGSWLSVGHPTIAEVMGRSGFDWLIVDMEHGIVGLESVQTMIQVLGATPAAPIVRVPWNEPVIIKQVMETGPMALMVPQVNSAKEAEAAVKATRYPPQGIRGIGCQRPAGFGASFDDYLHNSNEELILIVQIEHVNALSNLKEIASVKGVDLLFVGANDLAASMGLLGQPKHERVLEAISTVLQVGRSARIPCGLMASDSEEANHRFREGFQFVGVGHDVGLLSTTCRQLCSNVNR